MFDVSVPTVVLCDQNLLHIEVGRPTKRKRRVDFSFQGKNVEDTSTNDVEYQCVSVYQNEAVIHSVDQSIC